MLFRCPTNCRMESRLICNNTGWYQFPVQSIFISICACFACRAGVMFSIVILSTLLCFFLLKLYTTVSRLSYKFVFIFLLLYWTVYTTRVLLQHSRHFISAKYNIREDLPLVHRIWPKEEKKKEQTLNDGFKRTLAIRNKVSYSPKITKAPVNNKPWLTAIFSALEGHFSVAWCVSSKSKSLLFGGLYRSPTAAQILHLSVMILSSPAQISKYAQHIPLVLSKSESVFIF